MRVVVILLMSMVALWTQSSALYSQSITVAGYWVAPAGDNAGLCTESLTDPGVYLTMKRAAICMTAAARKMYVKGNLGTYTGSNHRIDVQILPAGSFASGTDALNLTTIMAVPGEPMPVIRVDNWFTTYISFQRNWFTIHGLRINDIDNTTPGSCAIQLTGGDHHVTIEDNYIENSFNMSICAHVQSGNPASQGHHLTIQRNEIVGHGRSGCGYGYYGGYDDLLFQDNIVRDGVCGYIQVYEDVVGFNADRAIIRRNRFSGLAGAPGFQGNFIGQCFGVVIKGNASQVYRNTIDLRNCAAAGTSGSGIQSGYQSNASAVVYHNVIFGAKSYGVYCGLFGGLGCTAYNNIVTENAGGPFRVDSGTQTQDHNWTTGTVLTCLTSYTVFTQIAGSPCINAGRVIVGFSTTTLGQDGTYFGTAPDIGSVESGSDTTAPAPPTGVVVTRVY